MRVLCHAQHLTGVGHFVRMHAIAVGLAEAHEVHLVDGGLPVVRTNTDAAPLRIPLPRLTRRPDGRLVTPDGAPAGRTLERRRDLLEDAARVIRPRAVLVDHYPFSKWELGDEIIAMIAAARDADPHVTVICSLRDITPPTQHDGVVGDEHAARVLALLDEHFDHVLVHADPAFTRLDEHFPRTGDLPVPVAYTGFVTEPVAAPPPAGGAWAVLSAGGLGATGFLDAAITGYLEADTPRRRNMVLHAFLDPAATEADLTRIGRRTGGGQGRVVLHRFSPAFGSWLEGAALSISRCGYNTSTGLMRSGVPAVVVPDLRLSDQALRADRLAAAGIAVAVAGSDEGNAGALAGAVETALTTPRRRPRSFDLGGVSTTRRLVEELVPSTA